MSTLDNWFTRLDSFCSEYEQALMTEAELEEILRSPFSHPDSPLSSISCEFCRARPFNNIYIGQPVADLSPSIYTYPLEDGLETTCKISLWRRTEDLKKHFDPVNTSRRVFELAKCFWKPKMRDTASGLISLKSPDAYQVVNYSLSRLFRNKNHLYVFFSDLDHFKQINDTLGQQSGDRVILELASMFDNAVRPSGLVLHRSGDEFIVLYPADFPDQALSLAYRMMHDVFAHDFKIGKLQVRASSGIAGVGAGEIPDSFKVLEERAERALKPKGAGKNRGKATFELTGAATSPPVDGKSSRNLASCIAKSCIASSRPFDSPWLNMLSLQVSEYLAANGNPAKVKSEVEKLVSWIQPDLDSQVVRSALEWNGPSDCSRRLSPFDLGIAVAHGILRGCLHLRKRRYAGKTLIIRCSGNRQTCELQLLPENEVLAHFGGIEARLNDVLNLGNFWSSSTGYPDGSNLSRLAFLIKIGHFELALPKSVFVEIMVLDDRPTMGGGLPDFWEATIARLIARADANPNVAIVYVLGKYEYAKQTVQKLKDIDSWVSQAEQIAFKTGMPTESICRVAKRLKDKICFPRNEQELLTHILDVVRQPRNLQMTSKASTPQDGFGLLSRDLSMREMALGTTDGCRVKTIAEAYPVVLEIARKVDEKTAIRDQAGQENLELIDFKVHVINPTVNLIPAFYEKEKGLLEQYFQDQFISDSGLFAQRFKENGQLQAVLKHVTDTVKDKHNAFATRRAIIVVPHTVQKNEDLAPLGLVSIRIIPRFLNDRVQLHYSYTWRTVEALVGFPYSLYGSVRFSQHITDELKKLLPEEDRRQVSMGEVSYIAHSLHIYKDDYGQNIARRIVNDASR